MTTSKARPKAARRTAYLVLGMHRSGTSALTQLLALAGASLPANVMPGDEHNAKGYFEPWKVALFNDARLRAGGGAWDDVFAYPYRPLDKAGEAAWLADAVDMIHEEYGAAQVPLLKDPRVTVLLPLWRLALDKAGLNPRAVIPLRSPLAVAGSLSRRDGFAREKSVLLWSAYMLAAEAYTRDMPRAFVGYDALLADWRTEAARIEASHDAPLPGLTEAAAAEIDGFLTPDLRHNSGSGDLSDLGWAGEIASQVMRALTPAAQGGAPDQAALAKATAALEARRDEFGFLVSPVTRDLDAVRARLLEAEQKLDRLEKQTDLKLLETRLQIAHQDVIKAGARLDRMLNDY